MKTCAKRPTIFGVAQLPVALLASLTGLILLLAVGANKVVASSTNRTLSIRLSPPGASRRW